MFSKIYSNYSYCLVVFILLFCRQLHAQSTEKIIIRPAVNKVTSSLYNKINVIDARPDNSSFGIVRKGMMSNNAKLILKQPLPIQFNNMLNDLIDDKAQTGDIVIQLRQLTFAEVTTNLVTQTAFFSLEANAFGKDKDGYKKIGSIDTLITLSATVDVTNKLLNTGGLIISGFIAANLKKVPFGSANYSYNDIANVDSIEKSRLKLYTTTTYTDGLYKNYKSFADQTPDGKLIVDGKKVTKKTVKVFDSNSAHVKPKLDSIYAIVHEGKPYIATPHDFYPIEKSNDELIFTGRIPLGLYTDKIKDGLTLMKVANALQMFSSSIAPQFEIKIYHKNGAFIRLKEIITDFGN